ncbi:lysophospholipid acyltransferase family protein [Cupriavidus neocaledonicus]|uniref:Glycerol acyltransferase n=1 Tax=Cupriavidus neocaledonicus TaxID=1040979 RepID=A0A375H919_9BURK|nr:lysophospholipid acyltransferase family protein [Cupriavidus neocaledonicus]SOZ35778.1 Phospholipid/glycerol acyltransferase; 1-ACYL-SN-GLYCEROL-3-PHOSPHATE ACYLTRANSFERASE TRANSMEMBRANE PROTEIN [Cupriavidus neocaledonicus]SPD47745.1 Glycerol acyltransferase [Cupriavidus neocaledonicus]
MIWLRKTALVLHLLRGLLTCALLFPWLGVRSREWHIRRWSRRLLQICGVEVEVVDATGATHTGAARQGAMVVSNHISWLDIYVIHSWQPVRFVAKSEIRSWPLIGWLCDKTGTIFIERARKRDAHRVLHDITDVMLQGDLVGVFPEGTTTDGTSVLPFHANLMQAPISGGLPVQPLGLNYLDAATGQPTLAAAYIGDTTLLQSLEAVLRAPRIKARLVLGPALVPASGDRRELAASAREVVAHLSQGAAEHAATAAQRLNQPSEPGGAAQPASVAIG